MNDKKFILTAAIGGIVGGVTSLGVFCLWKHFNKPACQRKKIERYNTENPRASGIVVHDNKVYLSGQVGDIDTLETSDVAAQTRQTLAKIDSLLSQVGVSKSNILEARIWLRNISSDFKAMNEVWNAWVDPDNKGTRYCVGAELARPTLLVEIQVTAAIL